MWIQAPFGGFLDAILDKIRRTRLKMRISLISIPELEVLSIWGCHFEPNTLYTSKKVKFLEFHPRKWNFYRFGVAILDQIRRTRLKKVKSLEF